MGLELAADGLNPLTWPTHPPVNLSWSPLGMRLSARLSDSFGGLSAAGSDFLSVPKPASVVRSANSPVGLTSV